MTLSLHPYQEKSLRFLDTQSRSALFLDCGMGKSAVVLQAFRSHRLPALIVAPKRVCQHTWPIEADKWRPDLSLALAIGTPTQRRASLNAGADITVISRDNMADAVGGPWRTVVLDELSGFKTKATTRWKSANRLAKTATYVWGLTGTPAPNGLMDLWAQIALLDGGERLGRTLGAFRSRYFRPGRTIANGIVTEWILHDGAAEKIHTLISDIALSILNPDLPAITYNTVVVDLPCREAYATIARDLVVDLEVIGGEVHSAANAAVLTGKLSQLAAGFIYSDTGDGTYTTLHTEKINALREVIEGTGSPVLVFYRFRAEREMLERAFPQARGLEAIEEWNAGEVPIMLAHPASAGHGLNLQAGGHTVVWMSLPWSLEEWLQANARLARQGQQNPVIVHSIVAENTIDAVIQARLTGKEFSQNALLDHLRHVV